MEDQVSCHFLAVRCLALLHVVTLPWSHSTFSTTPCLLIPRLLGEEEQKGGKNTTELRAVCYSYFFPFCHHSTLYVLNICQDSPPKLTALNSPTFFNTSLGILVPLFLSNFILFSLFLSSFLHIPPYFPQSLSPLQERKKKKEWNELHFNNQNNSETMLLRSHLLPTHLPRQQMMGIPG